MTGSDEPTGSAPEEGARDAGAGPAPDEGTAAALAREVYWAGDGVPRSPTDVSSVRERLDAFAHQLRVEERQGVPLTESLLDAAAVWKRKVKLFVWRLTRFSTRRYDRLLADLAEMNGELAQRLQETEQEVARLRAELERRDGEPS